MPKVTGLAASLARFAPAEKGWNMKTTLLALVESVHEQPVGLLLNGAACYTIHACSPAAITPRPAHRASPIRDGGSNHASSGWTSREHRVARSQNQHGKGETDV